MSIGDNIVTEIILNNGSFGWITIDMEHSVISIEKAQDLIRVISTGKAVPLVRVGNNDPYLIKRVMDAGAHGVIVPMVNSREQAEAAVAAVKYPPQGTRGVGLARAQGYGFGFESYSKWLVEESIVIVQIEHIDAINNLEDILNSPGVDGSIIGPYDLSGSLGTPGDFTNPEFLEALEKYNRICGILKRPKGIHIVQPDVSMFKKYLDQGFCFIAFGLDAIFLGNTVKEIMTEISKAR